MYTKIEFKLNSARKIEIKLTDAVNKSILYHYYYAINGIFIRQNYKWVGADCNWFPQAQRIFSAAIKHGNTFNANIAALRYIWNYYKYRPNSEVINNRINYNANRYNVITFYGGANETNVRYWHISFQRVTNNPYSVYVSPDSNWYKKRSYNIFRFFKFQVIIDNPYQPLGPIRKLAHFVVNNKGGSYNADFTQGWTIPETMQIEKKVIGNDILKTDLFYEKEKKKDLTPSALDKYKLTDLKISGNDFTDLNKTIKPTEFAFFLYENSNIIKETFVSELNKKVSLLGGVWYYVKADSKDGKIELITPRNKLKFNVKQNVSLSDLNLSIAPVIASQKLNLRERKIKNLLIISTFSKTRKRKMKEILDTIMVKALQKFENYTILNPLDIDIRSNYMTEKIEEFKYSVYQVMLKNILFSANIVNNTQQIFITCYNLDSAKKALSNGKLYSILGIINLSEIKNWEEVKGKSIYVNAKFDDITANTESTIHFGFKFNSAYPTKFFEFKIELLDDQAKKIEFADGKKKVPALDLQINIL